MNAVGTTDPSASPLAATWPIQALQQILGETVPGFAVEVVCSIGSTNSELMRRARAGELAPVLLVAEQQTAGRGRLGRSWISSGAAVAPPDAPANPATSVPGALTFSIGMALAPQDWSGLSLAVGVSVARALHPALALKWPNDIWLQECKLAGILIETAQVAGYRYAVVGVGINIGPRQAAGLSTPPAWLQQVLPDCDAPAALLRIAPPLLHALRLFEGQGFAAFHAAFRQRDVLQGRAVQLSDGITGTAAGVDGRGALLVHTSSGMKPVTSAEVSVRPVHAPADNR